MELFVYGTLRDAEYRRALFGEVAPARPATLADWAVVVAETGYLTVVAAPGETVNGDLLTLDGAALDLADAWEDVPAYERVPVEAREIDGTLVAAFVYVRPTASRHRASAGMLARHSRRHVLDQIRAVRRDYVRTKSERA